MNHTSFRTRLERSGSKVILPLPFDPNEAWGMRERHHVRGTIQGIAYRGEVRQLEKRFFLPVGPAWLRDAGLDLDQEVEVILEAEGPQVERMAEDIGSALAASPQARAFFEALPTFYRKNYMRWIESAKRPETREARIREAVELLAQGKRSK